MLGSTRAMEDGSDADAILTVVNPAGAGAETDTEVDQAWAQARAAALAAGADIRELRGDDVLLAGAVVDAVWGPGQIPQQSMLRAFAHAGSTLLGASVAGRPVGMTLGFLGWNGGLHLHSHMTAVLPEFASTGIGYALKLWQRAVCLREGIDEVRWTYDPMVARNARFNLVKLGAVAISFQPNFYGAMTDAVNAGDESDRFEVSWRLDSRRVTAALAGALQPPTDVVGSLAIPADYLTLARTDPPAARAARQSARSALLEAQREALAVEWGSDAYLFARAQPGHELRPVEAS
jgi:predicted GNAT superfamily acetyltransferase